MTTIKQSLLLTEPIRFLGSTVLSFNMSIGLGTSAESTLTVDLIEDCYEGDQFQPMRLPNNYGVGMPVYFPDNPTQMPECSFGGILSSWTAKQSSSGFTFDVVVKDPRQLLENTLIVIDSLIAGPQYHINYFNVYAYWEQAIIYSSNCFNYGLSQSNENGMPYYRIVETLQLMDINIFPSTYDTYPYTFKIDFNTFPGIALGSRTLPLWYRIPGPGISLLQLLEDICSLLAYDFYVYLVNVGGVHMIKVGLIDLNVQPTSFSYIINNLADASTDVSYGQEFRNEKNKVVLVGDSVHYLSPTNTFDHFFGEDVYNGVLVPVVPYGYDDCGFWISKKIDHLNLTLNSPLPSNGPYTISELDIRSAMSSYEMWVARTFDANTPGSLNAVIRAKYPLGISDNNAMIQAFTNLGSALDTTEAVAKNFSDGMDNPSSPSLYRNRPDVVNELKKMHNFIANLGSTYYGKQYITRLDKQKICKKYDTESNTYIYSDTPTNNGGWVDYNISVLGLNEPELGNFRTDDNRVKGFAQFVTTYNPSTVDPVANANTDNSGQGSNASALSQLGDLGGAIGA